MLTVPGRVIRDYGLIFSTENQYGGFLMFSVYICGRDNQLSMPAGVTSGKGVLLNHEED